MKNAGKGGMGGLLFKKHTRNPYLLTPHEHPIKVISYYPTPISRHLFSEGRGKDDLSFLDKSSSPISRIAPYHVIL